MRLATIAPFFRYPAAPRSALLHSLLGVADEILEAWGVFAVEAPAVIPALLALRKTLAVHLQAKSFLARTANLALLARMRRCGHRGQSFSERVLGWRVVGNVEVVERGLRRDGIEGVDHLETLVDLGELVERGEVEHGNLGVLIHIIIL